MILSTLSHQSLHCTMSDNESTTATICSSPCSSIHSDAPTESDDHDCEISRLVALRHEQQLLIQHARSRLQHMIKAEACTDRKIWRKCNHLWVLDDQQELGPYDRRDSICVRCTSRKIAPGR